MRHSSPSTNPTRDGALAAVTGLGGASFVATAVGLLVHRQGLATAIAVGSVGLLGLMGTVGFFLRAAHAVGIPKADPWTRLYILGFAIGCLVGGIAALWSGGTPARASSGKGMLVVGGIGLVFVGVGALSARFYQHTRD